MTLNITTLCIEYPFADYRYADCRFSFCHGECCYAECHHAECRHGECDGALCTTHHFDVQVNALNYDMKQYRIVAIDCQ